ncbi:isoleucine--tRNA ligase [Sediminivirga luteola]|uniref:Isoleucine--tRNA ligase n=1 Tax=Sediminivirga luteola TaxID=1774748 RepID=A0A8J2TZH4_9MICO|nr:isoleucine--tRNA ligase [Sediminivirga luteola]MCI2264274.1 isoleucine--tRNA ligase [Sediminivirga luteola]GGA20754.1 isoleucine--tRNA ligase [Sediminivirga luteola]
MTENPSPVYPRRGTADERRIPASPRFPRIEDEVLGYWAEDGTFQASIESRPAGESEYVFYDGPPFANGLPHYGHLLTGYVKDLVARYQTQRGRRVERRFGWDTHGLPAELEAMKQLGMTDKAEIEAMGIDKFNDACRASVLKYTREWEEYVTRQARWVDFENDYKTLNVEYMESVIWAFKQLHEKGLTYQGFRVLPYCWKDETPLSNHELRMDDDVYKDRQDPSVTVAFPITGGGADARVGRELAGVNLLAWTTTPWTLPTNFSVAVGPEIEYVVVEAPKDGPLPGKHLLAADLLGAYAKDLGFAAAEDAEAAVVARYRGTELAGLEYQPLWGYYADVSRWGTQNAFRVLVEDYVTTTDGTGLVHQASAYGEEDQRSSEEAGIPVILSVDEGARFLPMFAEPLGDGTAPLADIAGKQVFEANRDIINRLKADGRLVREQSYVHSYPHCWRCRTPLIYKAVTSWYVAVTQFKDRMLEINEQINWIPGNVKHGQFGKWLEGARDWSISRNRYWGSPIPVWVSDDPAYPRTEVYGSLEELKEAFGDYPRNADGEPDLHRPWIDRLTRPNPDDPTGRSTMRRVEDVLDVWFDSGSMQFAQVHYPFENKDWFDSHHPADFIVEYIGQTRGWFYTMHILATALFDRPAFTNVISHGIVLGSDGQKMSKSLRNYPDVTEVLDRDGSDAMRWFLMASPILRGGNLVVTEEGIREGVRQVLLPMWNAWHFFALYANTARGGQGYQAKPVRGQDVDNPLDRYILAATGDLVREATAALDAYDVSSACEALRAYSETLTNWYIRRSRQRFYDEDTAAYDVLYTALETFTRVAAPLLPLISEEIWRGLTGGRSVHLADWPEPDDYLKDERAVELMELTRTIASAGSALRKQAGRRVRLPLRRMTAVVPGAEALRGTYQQIIADELNLKEVELLEAAGVDPAGWGIGQRLAVNARAAGPRLGKQVQQAIKGAKTGDWSVQDGVVTAGGIELQEGEYALETVAEAAQEGMELTVLPGGGFLALDTTVTPELEAEGLARDTVRAIQSVRKALDLDVSDRIEVEIAGAPEALAAAEAHAGLVKTETLALTLRPAESLLGDDVQGAEVGEGLGISLRVVRA